MLIWFYYCLNWKAFSYETAISLENFCQNPKKFHITPIQCGRLSVNVYILRIDLCLRKKTGDNAGNQSTWSGETKCEPSKMVQVKEDEILKWPWDGERFRIIMKDSHELDL